MMSAIYIIFLSVGAALVCSTLRVHRPEVATAVSLAAGLAALLLTGDSINEISEYIRQFVNMSNIEPEGIQVLVKSAGLTILCELGGQICSDAGESALAGRIRLTCRIAILCMALPFLIEILDSIGLYSY